MASYGVSGPVDVKSLPWSQRFLKSLFGDTDKENKAERARNADGEEKALERGKWGSKAEFVLSALGYAVGLGNVWRFPWMCWRNGGGAFLIPYFIMLVFAGLPIFFMEVILGQYSGVGPNKLFELAPLFKGLGVGMISISFFTSLYYNVIIMWSLYYMFSSFQAFLPWVGCNNLWNTDNCFDSSEEKACERYDNGTSTGAIYLYRKCYNATVVAAEEIIVEFNNTLAAEKNASEKTRIPAAEEFFNQKMYAVNFKDENGTNTGIMRPMENIGAPKWDITLTLILSWTIIYLCILKGIKTSGKVVYFTATFPYIVILILLVFGATLDGAEEGVLYYIRPDFSKLWTAQIWLDAAGQIFFSLSVGMGGLMTYASYNEFNNNILRDTLIVSVGNCITSVIAGFPIFSILGFMAKQLGKKVPEVVQSGSALAFIAYPEVVSKMPAAQFWSTLFFFMVLTLGLDSQFAGIEVLLTAITDSRPKLIRWKPLISGCICICLFLLTLTMSCDAGIYWEELINTYSGWSLVLIGFAEVLVFGWVYGAENLLDNVQEMLNTKFRVSHWWFWRILWRGVTPILLAVIVVFNFIGDPKVSYGGYVLPRWAQSIGWCTATIPVILIPVYSLLVYIYDLMCNPDSGETILQRLHRLIKPSEQWQSSPVRYGEALPMNGMNSDGKGNSAVNSVNSDGKDNSAYIQSKHQIS
ncbi:sodium- and chloride-dependent GABA transporter 1-like [Watersipora subatra]|uniref:sodium- and chloride-dependent GABA transporter 1-like n=1 Tax=Watersipora subatra TaxID=2589382 RepID=UPI00355B1210